MNAPHFEDSASQYFSMRLSRQNRYLDFLETALDQGRTETEARVVLSLLQRSKQSLDRLEHEFLESCGH